jgi:O-antigen/teichoic acid export membrane protein
MGLAWAVLWALVGGLIEAADNVTPGGLPAVHVVDMWPQTLALIGFPHGVVFAVVLGLARGRRRFDEFSLPQFAAWGAAAALALGALAVVRGASFGYVGITTVLSAAAGAGSLALARVAERRGLLGAGADAAGARLADGTARELPRPGR